MLTIILLIVIGIILFAMIVDFKTKIDLKRKKTKTDSQTKQSKPIKNNIQIFSPTKENQKNYYENFPVPFDNSSSDKNSKNNSIPSPTLAKKINYANYRGDNQYLINLKNILQTNLEYKDVFLITGSAGSGKSTLINELSNWFKKNKINFALTSSTGMSSIAFENATTIHSFLGLGIYKTLDDFYKIKGNSAKWSKIQEKVKRLEILIIDEISMIWDSQFDLIEKILREAKENDLLFGGIKIFLFGDFYQLPPIAPKNEKNSNPANPLIFKSALLNNERTKFILLSNIYRQDDDVFKNILENVRQATNKKEIIEQLKPYQYTKFEESIESVKLFTTTKSVEMYNEASLSNIDSKQMIFEGEYVRHQEIEIEQMKHVVKKRGFSEELKLKVGASVVHLINDQDRKIVNGSIGIIQSMNLSSLEVLFHDGRRYQIEQHIYKHEDDEENVIFTFKQFPLKLAFAITVHKSQGMTIEHLDIDCTNFFAEGQFYVALSRLKKLKNLKLSNFDKLSENSIKTSKEVKDFFESTDWENI